MVELNIFHYIYKDSLIHKMDSRIKLICMFLASISISFTSNKFVLAFFSVMLLLTLYAAKLPALTLLREIKYFIYLIIIVFCVRSFTIPGKSIEGFPIHGVTAEGVESGLLFGWQLVLIIIACLILTATTTLVSLRDAIEWFLSPIPFIPAARVSVMVNLTFVLIPLIFDQACEIMNAQKARCISGRKNPVERIKFTAIPLLFQTFRRADEMTLAMEARGFTEDRTKAVFKTNSNDWLILAFLLLVSSAAFIVKII